MRHQTTGSIVINLDGITEAVVEALRPLLAERNTSAPAALTPEQFHAVLTEAIGGTRLFDNGSETSGHLAMAIMNRLAGYDLVPTRATPPTEPAPDPEQTSRFGFFGGAY